VTPTDRAHVAEVPGRDCPPLACANTGFLTPRPAPGLGPGQRSADSSYCGSDDRPIDLPPERRVASPLLARLSDGREGNTARRFGFPLARSPPHGKSDSPSSDIHRCISSDVGFDLWKADDSIHRREGGP
jgi:hypothetical protein